MTKRRPLADYQIFDRVGRVVVAARSVGHAMKLYRRERNAAIRGVGHLPLIGQMHTQSGDLYGLTCLGRVK